jgi:AraC-like DNA-binding protein
MQRTPPARELSRPILPGNYIELWLRILESRGVSRRDVLRTTGITAADLSEEGRVAPVGVALAISRGVSLTGDPTLAFEFGLTMKPTAHGVFGYALMTCATLRDAVLLGQRYLPVQVPHGALSLREGAGVAAIRLGDKHFPSPLRPFIYEVYMGALVRAGESLLGLPLPNVEIWLDYPEPGHFTRIKDRLPPVRFDAPAVELRFDAALLERPLLMADPMAHRSALATLERASLRLGGAEGARDVAQRLRALLEESDTGALDLTSAARALRTSERSLKRHLAAEGTSFSSVASAVRLERAQRLLRDPGLTVERVAEALGYTDPANFTRAFRKWAGESPRAYRDKQRTR